MGTGDGGIEVNIHHPEKWVLNLKDNLGHELGIGREESKPGGRNKVAGIKHP